MREYINLPGYSDEKPQRRTRRALVCVSILTYRATRMGNRNEGLARRALVGSPDTRGLLVRVNGGAGCALAAIVTQGQSAHAVRADLGAACAHMGRGARGGGGVATLDTFVVSLCAGQEKSRIPPKPTSEKTTFMLDFFPN